MELEIEVEMKMVKMWRVALPLGEGSRRFGGDRSFKNMICLYKKISIAAGPRCAEVTFCSTTFCTSLVFINCYG